MMKKILKKLPMPITGLMLGIAALGNLLASFHPCARWICGGLACIIGISVALKIIVTFADVCADMHHSLIASVFPTYMMGIMLLAGYIKPFAPYAAASIWYIAVICHLCWIIFFSIRFLSHFDIRTVFPSWFIVYVGIAVGAVSGSVFNSSLSVILFYTAVIFYAVLLPIVLYRVIWIADIQPAALPTLIIFAAPASLCLTAYLNAFKQPHISIVIVLLVLSIIFYGYAVFQLPAVLKLPFYPSYSALTFPFVISASALKAASLFFMKRNFAISILPVLTTIETILAVLFVVYVFVRYTYAILKH